MTAKKPRRFWRTLRIAFRWSRISILLLFLAITVAVIYLNSIGLPDFLKEPLLAELRKQGWEVEFKEMRWNWFRGVIIEQATFSPIGKDSRIRFSARSAEFNMNLSRIRQSQVTLESAQIHGGKFITSIGTNAEPLQVTEVNGLVHFLPGDRLVIDSLNGRFREVQVKLSCDLANASALGDVQPAPSEKTAKPASPKWYDVLQQIEFTGQPEVSLAVSGDAREWRTLSIQLKLSNADASTPWGQFRAVQFDGQMNPPGTTNHPLFAVDLAAGHIATPWVEARDFRHLSQITVSALHSNALETVFDLSTIEFHGGWTNSTLTNVTQGKSIAISGIATIPLTNLHPINATAEVKLGRTLVRWNGAALTNGMATVNQGTFKIGYDSSQAANHHDASSLWSFLHPFTLSGEFDLRQIREPRFHLENTAHVIGEWQWPHLKVKQLTARLDTGDIRADGSLNVATGSLSTTLESREFDFRKISSLLPERAAAFLADWTWTKPPRIDASVQLRLPTSESPHTVLDSLAVDAHLILNNSSYRGIETTFASAELSYSNRVWRLPKFEWISPDGHLNGSIVADNTTRQFESRIEGALDPVAFRPLLPSEQQKWIDQATFEAPPELSLNIAGYWDDIEALSVFGYISTEAFNVRGVDFSGISMRVNYTNAIARFENVDLRHYERKAEADRITLTRDRIYFHNVTSTLDPMLIAEVIGDEVVEVLSPYQFASPPHILLNGSLGLKTIEDADMHFQIAGDKFQWGLFHADAASGGALWIDETLTLTNLNALAYGGGNLNGNAFIDFTPPGGKAAYRLEGACTNVDVQALVLSLNATNQIEGKLSGTIRIDSADTTGLHTWNGQGHAELTDGLIWEIPIFGIFSPIFDAIVPGMGKSRARSATTDFIITNGVAYSDNFEIRSAGFRMQYRGTFSHTGEIDARVIAEPLRDAWAIGKILSTALLPISKLFEYKVTGPAANPQTKPVYMPRALMMALRPLKTIRGLLPDDNEESSTMEIPSER